MTNRSASRHIQATSMGLLGLVMLASCTSAPKYRALPRGVVSDDPQRQEVVQYAKTFLGTPYRNGGTTRDGMDCSGLVTNVYSHFRLSLPRTSMGQSRVGDKVPRTSVAPGDLVFFKTTSKTIGHVGIYIGKGQFIHASTGARRVKIDALDDDYFKRRFVTARRVIDD